MLLIRLKYSNNIRNSKFYSTIEKLKGVGFSEIEAKEIEKSIDTELEKLTEGYATLERLKKLQMTLDDKISYASSFVTSTSPFQMSFSNSNTTSNTNSSIIPLMNPVIDPLVLEKEIKTTGQQLSDEIKQLQADYQLDANLEIKRREDVDLALEAKLEASSEYAAERVRNLNEHLNRVSRQALTAIGGNQAHVNNCYYSYFYIRFYWGSYYSFRIIFITFQLKKENFNFFKIFHIFWSSHCLHFFLHCFI